MKKLIIGLIVVFLVLNAGAVLFYAASVHSGSSEIDFVSREVDPFLNVALFGLLMVLPFPVAYCVYRYRSRKVKKKIK